ncbi:MAG: DUF6364 family protein [bacterium]
MLLKFAKPRIHRFVAPGHFPEKQLLVPKSRKTTKLTLAIDPGVVRRAKSYASAHNTTVSKLVESYLRRITADAVAEEAVGYGQIPSVTQSLIGARTRRALYIDAELSEYLLCVRRRRVYGLPGYPECEGFSPNSRSRSTTAGVCRFGMRCEPLGSRRFKCGALRERGIAMVFHAVSIREPAERPAAHYLRAWILDPSLRSDRLKRPCLRPAASPRLL